MSQLPDSATAVSGESKSGTRNVTLVFAGLMVAMLLASLDQTIFSAALPTIVGQLHGVDHMLWVVTAYLLASTIVLPIYGKLGDLVGRKTLFIAAIAIFILGSIVGGFAQNMTWLIIGRTIEGLGGGGLVILAETIIADIVPARQRPRYMGIMGGVFTLSAVAGPLLGGWFTDVIGWRWGLWMNIPLGALAMASAGFFLRLPKVSTLSRVTIDWAGMGLIALASTCLVLVTTWGGTTYGWASPQIIALILATVIASVVFVLVERRAVEPVMPLALFKDRNFNVATLAGLIVSIAMFGAMAYLPTYLQMVAGVDATQAGLLMLPLLIAMMIASILGGQVVSKTGRYKWLPIAGTTIVVASLVLLSTMTPDLPIWVMCCYVGLMGAGLGAGMQILLQVAQNSFPSTMLGAATASHNYFRQIGSSLGGAIVGSVFAAKLASLFADRIPAGAALSPDSLTPTAVKALPGKLHGIVVGAYNDALTPLFLYLVPVVVAAVVFLWFIVELPLATTIEGAADDAVGDSVNATTGLAGGAGLGRDDVTGSVVDAAEGAALAASGLITRRTAGNDTSDDTGRDTATGRRPDRRRGPRSSG